MTVERAILRHLLEGAEFAGVKMPWNSPGPIRLPSGDDLDKLIDAHLTGGPATVLFSPLDKPAELHQAAEAKLYAYATTTGPVKWIGLDLDSDDHGEAGLRAPLAAARCIVERGHNAGIDLLAIRSGGGKGAHVFGFFPEAIPLDDAVLGVARLATDGIRIATADVADSDGEIEHAFLTGKGEIAVPGTGGCLEFRPHSVAPTARGLLIALPFHRGRPTLNVFTEREQRIRRIPYIDPMQWERYVREARARIPRPSTPATPKPRVRWANSSSDPLGNLDVRSQAFLDGITGEGARNASAYATACRLIARGIPDFDIEQLILAGAAGCGLPELEARRCIQSAVSTMRRKEASSCQ